MKASSDNPDVMVNYLLVMLQPTAMNLLTSLQLDIIDSWDDLKNMFLENYKATYEWLATKHDLARVY